MKMQYLSNYEFFTLARAIHVLGVVIWIGGVAFVTTILIPALRQHIDAGARLDQFERLEGRFGRQARWVTLITGASGFLMVEFLDAWARYQDLRFWWMHLMTLIWLIFTLILFVLEPLFLHRWFHQRAECDDTSAFGLLHRMHIILLTLSVVAVLGAVAGAHGLNIFAHSQ